LSLWTQYEVGKFVSAQMSSIAEAGEMGEWGGTADIQGQHTEVQDVYKYPSEYQ
jgi:hypothetical protein